MAASFNLQREKAQEKVGDAVHDHKKVSPALPSCAPPPTAVRFTTVAKGSNSQPSTGCCKRTYSFSETELEATGELHTPLCCRGWVWLWG
jgi:hypothetical protein